MVTICLACPIGKPATAAAALAAVLLVAPSARAASLTWDSGGVSPANPADGSGTWDTAATNWWNGSADVAWNNTTNAGDTAVFGVRPNSRSGHHADATA